TRADLLNFIDATFAVRVSRVALYHFLKKFGLDAAEGRPTAACPKPLPPEQATAPLPAVPLAPPFCSAGRATPAPSCCWPLCSAGGRSPATASPTRSAR